MVIIFKTDDHNNKRAVINIDNSPCRDTLGFDYDTSWHISKAYAKTGKALANFGTSNHERLKFSFFK